MSLLVTKCSLLESPSSTSGNWKKHWTRFTNWIHIQRNCHSFSKYLIVIGKNMYCIIIDFWRSKMKIFKKIGILRILLPVVLTSNYLFNSLFFCTFYNYLRIPHYVVRWWKIMAKIILLIWPIKRLKPGTPTPLPSLFPTSIRGFT